MNRNTRIQLGDTPLSAMLKLAEGNPGAATAMAELFKRGAAIDPDSAWGGFGVILALDAHGIYGSHIWMLYKDCCDCDPVLVVAALRAVQLGLFRESELLAAIRNSAKLDHVNSVRKELPRFAPIPEGETAR